jgi:adenylate cyclase
MSETRGIRQIFDELRRRKVIRVAVVYAVVAWLLIQVAQATFPPLNLPSWTVTFVIMLAILGFPIAIALAWAFEATPEGIRRERAAAEAAEAADAGTAPARVTDSPSIAVLPFVDMSPDRDQDYFCEGMAEEILNALTRVEGLRVAARTSSFQFKGRTADVRKVAKELGVSSVLEGSVRKAGSQLRVTAQLISAGDGYHLWSDRYDRGLEDVFAIQDEIATKITEALKLHLTRQDLPSLQVKPTGEILAYDYYLRGRQLLNQFGKRRTEYAIQMFNKAIELDPNYAPAYAGLTQASAMMYMFFDPDPKYCATAERASARAIALDPGSAEAHTTRGIAEQMNKNFDAAEQAFDRAIALNPKSFDAAYFCARGCASHGHYARAAAMFERAAEVRPEDYQALLLAMQIYRAQGRLDEERSAAERGFGRARRTLELNPGDVRALYLGASALVRLGRKREALEWGERALALEPDEPSVFYNVACVYAQSGEEYLERAMDLLERAVLPGMANRIWVEHDSDLDALREVPRFKAFLATLK